MNKFVTDMSKMGFALDRNALVYKQIYGFLFGIFAVLIPMVLLHNLFLDTVRPRIKLILAGCMLLDYIVTVLGLAYIFCYMFPTDPESIWSAWAIAFLFGTGLMVLSAVILWFSRPKRKLTEDDKMKLKDI